MRKVGRASAAGFRWLKGRARFEGGEIVLDSRTITEYQPFADKVTDYPYELAAIAEPGEAVTFARRFGLLRFGPGAEQLREPWAEWERAALQVRAILRLGVDLGDAVRGDSEAIASLRAQAERWGHLFEARAANDEELLSQTSVVVAQLVNEGLDDVGFGVQAEVGLKLADDTEGRPGRFTMSPRSPNLLGLIYYALALALVSRIPGRECEGCGRIFPVRDPRQRYHDPQCAQRTRYRRWAEKGRDA